MNKISKLLENFTPLIISLIAFYYVKSLKLESINNIKDIIMSIINFIAILSGFLTTMLSILITSSEKGIMLNIKEAGKLLTLYRFVSMPIIIGFINIPVCLILLSTCELPKLYENKTYLLMLFLSIYFILLCIRAIVYLFLVVMKDSNGKTGINEEEEKAGRNVDYSKSFPKSDNKD